MVLLSKLLPLFVLPLGITLILILAGVFLRRRSLLIAAAAGLWLASTPLVAGKLLRLIEGGAVRLPAAAMPEADAVVVLGTGRVTAPGPGATSEWTDADRFFGGVELFKEGRAPMLVFTGGASPWEPAAPLEGDILAEYAKALGVPADRIVTTTRVFNTAEEASAVQSLMRGARLRGPRILLVTSAFHMARAGRLFTQAGFEVIPFPVDFARTERSLSVLDLLPDADALAGSQGAIREVYGRAFYRLVAR